MKKEVPMTVHGQIIKNRNEVVLVDTHIYKGIPVLDIRIHFINSDGDKKPTQKGVTIQLDKLGKLNEILSGIQD